MLSGIRWGSLRTKIIAWSFVPTAIILAAVAWVTFSAYRQVTEDLVIERDQELTHLSTGEFAARLSEYPAAMPMTSAKIPGSMPVHPIRIIIGGSISITKVRRPKLWLTG